MTAKYPWHCDFHAENSPSSFADNCGCYERMMEWLSEHLSSLDNCPKCGDTVSKDWKDAMENIRGMVTIDLWHEGTSTFIGCYDCSEAIRQAKEYEDMLENCRWKKNNSLRLKCLECKTELIWDEEIDNLRCPFCTSWGVKHD